MVLHPMPWRFGYSQLVQGQRLDHKPPTGRETYSKSTPSSLCFFTRLVMVFTNAVLLAALSKAEEKNRDPVHFKMAFGDRPKRDGQPATHTSDRDECLHTVSLGSGDELGQEFFPSGDG